MRECILNTLRQEKHISGEEIGQRLNISRNAVWKHVNELRLRGYKIDSSPRTGYSFLDGTELLVPEEIRHELDTRVIGDSIYYYNEIPSTQDIALDLAGSGSAEGTLVVSEMQTASRGRKGREWISLPDGGIYLSIILRPPLMPSEMIQIPLVAGIAVVKAINKAGSFQASLKWPNDVMVGRKKVGGILTEMRCEIDAVKYVVLGIGLNANTPMKALAGQTGGAATSLAADYGTAVSRVKLVRDILKEIELAYTHYLVSGFESMRNEWKLNCLTLGSMITVRYGNDEIHGEALDIDDGGYLLVRKQNNDIVRIVSGDISQPE